MTPEVTVGVTLFGPHSDLARRCLDPLWPLLRLGKIELRIGCNDVGAETRAYLDGKLADGLNPFLIMSSANVHKYPMMRNLIGMSPLRPKFMWFDDDSYIDDPDPLDWLARALALCEPHTMVGQVWTMRLGGGQHLWVRDQPWYAGKTVEPGHTVRFCQGAWWLVPSALLYKHDWPDPRLERKGGDVMLGELCRQQGVVIRDVGKTYGVRINADEKGQHSRSKTRGPMPLPKPIGWDYQPGASARVLDTLGDAP